MVRLPERGSDDRQNSDENPSLAALSAEVKELVRLISATDVTELHIESGQVRITIRRGLQASSTSAHSGGGNSVYTPPATLPASETPSTLNLIGHSPAHGEEVELAPGEHLLVAPMVGTFYVAPAPTEPPFVNEGDAVEPGQPIGIIEAMKMMNEIEAEVGGTIKRILVQNAQPVEYGQPLMVVQTS